MQITITAILAETAVPIRFTSIDGFWVNFTAEHIVGSAIFVPYNSENISALIGQTFFVELNHERIINFQCHRNDFIKCSIIPLAEIGNYKVTGKVTSVVFVDNGKTALIDLKVGDANFTIDSNEIMNQIPQVGEIVSFDLIELSLWDENL